MPRLQVAQLNMDERGSLNFPLVYSQTRLVVTVTTTTITLKILHFISCHKSYHSRYNNASNSESDPKCMRLIDHSEYFTKQMILGGEKCCILLRS